MLRARLYGRKTTSPTVLPSCRNSTAYWRSYLGRLSDADLDSLCTYTNSKGDTFSSKVIDILNQLILHAAHHRGQISLEVRRTGATPAPVDYIHAVRKDLLARH